MVQKWQRIKATFERIKTRDTDATNERIKDNVLLGNKNIALPRLFHPFNVGALAAEGELWVSVATLHWLSREMTNAIDRPLYLEWNKTND